MQYISYFLILSGLFATTSLYPQSKITSSFGAPVNFPMVLSGNYGEIRSTHFHAGIDIKTEQVEGKSILAAESGYVYRIAVQGGGNGKAVYMRHPNDKVTVYCHLSKFEPEIEKFVRDAQYKKKSYEVDLYIKASQYPFDKGSLLGYSGNTGNSEGPHLHFEIRDKSGAITYNPLNYGFAIDDQTFPKIKWLMINPLDDSSTINGSNQKKLFRVLGQNGQYFIAPDTLIVNGRIGLGIETYDYLDNAGNECGPYTLSMKLDDKPIFMCRIDSIPFSSTAYVNSHIDYEEKIKSGRKIQKLYIDPNNLLKIYKLAINRGVIQLDNGTVQPVVIEVKDTYGNASVLRLNLQKSKTMALPDHSIPNPDVKDRFAYDSLNVFESSNIRVVVPRNALFDHLDFTYTELDADIDAYSSIHKIHNEFTPLFKSYILSIKTRNLPTALHNKALIVNQKKDGTWVSQGGEYKNGFVTTRVKLFGLFKVTMDTTPPLILPKTFIPEGRYTANQTFTFIIDDSLSGIRKYSGFVDNNWALFEFDPKNDLLTYTVDKSRLIQNKSHTIDIYVTDNKDNAAHYQANFFY